MTYTDHEEEDLEDLLGPQTMPPLPDSPTDARPGSPEKMAVLRERLLAGRQLFHPEDRVGCAWLKPLPANARTGPRQRSAGPRRRQDGTLCGVSYRAGKWVVVAKADGQEVYLGRFEWYLDAEAALLAFWRQRGVAVA